MICPFKGAPKKRTRKPTDNTWKERYKQAYYDYQRKEYKDVCDVGGMCLIRNYPRVYTHKGLEEAGENYIKWIGGASTNTPTTGTPLFEKGLVNGKMVNVFKGYGRAKGGKGKMDTDFIYKGVNFKVDWKVGCDEQSPEQLKYQRKIEKAGGKYYLVHDMNELYKIVDWIDEHGNLTYFSLSNSTLF